METKVNELDDKEVADYKKRMKKVFSLFDKEGKNRIIKEEVPTAMRYLGLFPTEREISGKILLELREEDEEDQGFVYYPRFESKMLEYFKNQLYERDSEDILQSAFAALDPERKGYISSSYMKEILTQMGGAPFRNKEVEAFMSVANDLETGRIYYGEYISVLASQVESNLEKQ